MRMDLTTSTDVLVLPTAKTVEYKNAGNGATGNNKTETIPELTTSDFTVEVLARTGGAGDTPPAYAELLKACGLDEVVLMSAEVFY